MNTRIKRLTALNYFGGKSRHLDWILPHIPEHKCYLEPFCGSAAVFLNKKPALLETISDKDGRLVNFFRVLRDNPQPLIEKLQLTLYARQEFQDAGEQSEDPIEDARRFFVRALQSFGGITHNRRRLNSFRVDFREHRTGMAASVSKFLAKIERLPEVVARFKSVQIENRDAFELIPRFGHRDCFIYQDPPYRHETRTSSNDYKYELYHEEHISLAKLNNESKAMIMISHSDDPFYDTLYPAPRWTKILGPERKSNLGKGDIPRECIWINY